jgi:hypothetical protein
VAPEENAEDKSLFAGVVAAASAYAAQKASPAQKDTVPA